MLHCQLPDSLNPNPNPQLTACVGVTGGQHLLLVLSAFPAPCLPSLGVGARKNVTPTGWINGGGAGRRNETSTVSCISELALWFINS